MVHYLFCWANTRVAQTTSMSATTGFATSSFTTVNDCSNRPVSSCATIPKPAPVPDPSQKEQTFNLIPSYTGFSHATLLVLFTDIFNSLCSCGCSALHSIHSAHAHCTTSISATLSELKIHLFVFFHICHMM